MIYDTQGIQPHGRPIQIGRKEKSERLEFNQGQRVLKNKKKHDEKTTFIYILTDPRNGAVRYVGKTINPRKRFRSHCNDSFSNEDKGSWIKDLRSMKMEPEMTVIEECAGKDWQESEKFWIAYLPFLGVNLLNRDSGGHGCNKKSERTKLKQRASMLGRAPSAEAIQKMVATRMRNGTYKPSDESNRKRSEKLRGRKRPSEVVAKIAASNRGKKKPPTSQRVRDYLSKLFKGRKNKPEWITAQKEAMRKKKESGWTKPSLSDVHKMNISRSLTKVRASKKAQVRA